MYYFREDVEKRLIIQMWHKWRNENAWGLSAARMRPKRAWSTRNKLAKIVTGVLYQFFNG